MKIEQIRKHALELLALADQAEAAGKTGITSVELTKHVAALDKASRDALAKAIAETAKKK